MLILLTRSGYRLLGRGHVRDLFQIHHQPAL
jgi:hypothetical protein